MPRNSRSGLVVAGALVALGLVTMAPREASAFCRTSTCPGNLTGTRCTPAGQDDCGTALFWPTACVSFSMQKDASKQVPLATATQVFTEAFASWTNADCGGGTHPRIDVVDLGPVVCDSHEYSKTLGNANIIMFRDDAWPYTGQGDTLALTTVTFNLDDGEIFDADIEVNSAQARFTTTDTNVVDDLLSVATHEAGHFLGLAHSPVNTSTMVRQYTPQTTNLRSLDPDDFSAICAVYPPGAPIPSDCDPTPRHGFSSVCAADEVPAKGCCTIAPGSGSRSPGAEATLGALAAAVVVRRLSRRRARR